MENYNKEQLDDMFYELEKKVNKALKLSEDLDKSLKTASYKTVTKQGRNKIVTINNNTAKEGDIVGVFKTKDEDNFKFE